MPRASAPPAPAQPAAPMGNTSFAARVTTRARQLRLSKKALAQRAGLSRQTLDNLLAQTPGPEPLLPSIRTLLNLAVALKVHPYWLTDALLDQTGVSPHLAALMKGERAGFVEDVSCPDGLVVAPGQHFVKVWLAQNLGVVDLAGYRLRCWDAHITPRVVDAAGQPQPVQWLVPDAPELPFPTDAKACPLGEGAVFSMSMGFTAPMQPGLALSYWMPTRADGQPCFSESAGLAVVVQVDDRAEVRRAMPTALPSTPAERLSLGIRPG